MNQSKSLNVMSYLQLLEVGLGWMPSFTKLTSSAQISRSLSSAVACEIPTSEPRWVPRLKYWSGIRASRLAFCFCTVCHGKEVPNPVIRWSWTWHNCAKRQTIRCLAIRNDIQRPKVSVSWCEMSKVRSDNWPCHCLKVSNVVLYNYKGWRCMTLKRMWSPRSCTTLFFKTN